MHFTSEIVVNGSLLITVPTQNLFSQKSFLLILDQVANFLPLNPVPLLTDTSDLIGNCCVRFRNTACSNGGGKLRFWPCPLSPHSQQTCAS